MRRQSGAPGVTLEVLQTDVDSLRPGLFIHENVVSLLMAIVAGTTKTSANDLQAAVCDPWPRSLRAGISVATVPVWVVGHAVQKSLTAEVLSWRQNARHCT
jgi:hypothetical protein